MKTDDKTGTVTRRAAMAGALAAAPAVAWSHNASDDLAKLDATATAKAIADKHITAAEAVEGAIRRAEALQPKLNFLVAADFDRALDKAKRGRLSGPFAGVPFLVKDLDDYIGLPTRSGSRATAGAKPATSQSAYMDCFDRAGLVVIGKSATPEYG
jgi:amidase